MHNEFGRNKTHCIKPMAEPFFEINNGVYIIIQHYITRVTRLV